LTLQEGFIIGSIMGFASWFILVVPNTVVTLDPGTILAGQNVAGLMFFVSFLWTPLSVIMHKSPGGTTATGFIFGFTSGFDGPIIALNLSKGQLPTGVIDVLGRPLN
jgi:hypothetical protein